MLSEWNEVDAELENPLEAKWQMKVQNAFNAKFLNLIKVKIIHF